uniref:EGF-like domain-containing protein n=1 Tax=Heterosigma akashiwo TaxID=2829 RepID=A0A7S3XN04_HETAK|mmetsp:Transcript_15328/g.27176  ORF Transcript_15328/g.27176 Transcript_15328/m.27176 type:complete len:689 (-) Transcript_15328:355-2421(-)
MALAWPFLVLSLCLQVFHHAEGKCHNLCNGKGQCNIYSQCECIEGYQGADCSEKICPFGVAWGDMPTDEDTAHAQAECSNRGICDRTNGDCTCMEGFTGSACERLSCESDCNGAGICLSYRKFAANYLNDDSVGYVYETPWDADKVWGCVCDEGFQNYDCILRECPTGDDPLTTGQVNEKQLFKCTASGGSFVLYYRGKPSDTIAYDATEDEVEAALTYINRLTEVDVSFGTGSSVCNADDINVVTVEFTQNFGEQPPLVAYTDGLDDGAITIKTAGGTLTDDDGTTYTSVTGTKENDVCSNRGTCDTSNGSCDCFSTNNDVYESSNGYADAGNRGDCGYPSTTIGACPGEVECSLNGYCDDGDQEYRCYCADTWFSGDCSLRGCPEGRSWFSYPSEDDKAHDEMVECSNMGICDTAEGVCSCRDGFFGAACEYMICGGGTDTPCNGNGQCLSMAELAIKATSNGDAAATTYGSDPNDGGTWDAHRLFHCLCDDGYEGYDCSLRSCPTGDDPATYDDAREQQLFQCAADAGTFTATFRQQTTGAINANATKAEFVSALEELSSINKVEVRFSSGATVCYGSSDDANTVAVRFQTPTGDLPDLTFDDSGLSSGSGTPITTATDGDTLGGQTSVQGTTEDVVCSNHGLCDTATGTCTCFPGWASSNGYGGEGELGDCGWRIDIKGFITSE